MHVQMYLVSVILVVAVWCGFEITNGNYSSGNYYPSVNKTRFFQYPYYPINNTFHRPYPFQSQLNLTEQNNGLWGRNYCIPPFRNCNGSHNLFVGCITPWDKLLFTREYNKPGHWWLPGREKNIVFPKELPPGYYHGETIAGIRIYDRKCNNTGGLAQIKYGGPGYRNVTIRLYTTGYGKSFHFLVEVYGK